MNSRSPMRLNEFVVIRRCDDGRFAVEYGPRLPLSQRYVADAFKNVDDAIAWVDRLDRTINGASAPAARHAG